MEITRREGHRSGYDYQIKQGDKVLNIVFGGNLDLYWNIINLSEETSLDSLYKEQYETFTITKENYFLYSLFKQLIEDVKEAKVFTPRPDVYIDEEYETLPDGTDNIETEEQRCNRWNEDLKKSERYKKMYDGKAISWHSDDEPYDIADRVRITENEDVILLEFYRPETILETCEFRFPGSISIRFRNSGSTYDPFNILFMKMYRELQTYNPDYHQMHIEEIEYVKRLQKIDK